MVWSATRLKTYLTCPRQFRYAYLDAIPSVPTSPLVFGRTLHEALCFVQEHQMQTGDLPPVEQTLEKFDALWASALSKEQPLFRAGAPSPAQHQTTGHEILRAYLSASGSQIRPLAAELAFEVAAGEYRLAGIVDRVEESATGLVIVDFKSSQRLPKQADLDGDLQFTLYAFALEQMLGQKVERVVHLHLRDCSRHEMIPGAEQFHWLLNEVLPYVAGAVARGDFAPRSGYWCNWCDYVRCDS
jgi:ATP-dependent helicase/DNAse subunit B